MAKTFRAPTSFSDKAFEAMQIGRKAGLGLKRLDLDTAYDGRRVCLDSGHNLLNFGGCSYMGLDQHPALKAGAADALERYGTQLSISRAYLENGLYHQLDEALGSVTGGRVLVSPTVTLGHIAAMPVLMKPGDGIIVDQFAHSSLQTAVGCVKDVHVERVKHNDVERLEAYIKRMSKTCSTVWYVLDGLYSMLGDFAPLEEIEALLAKYPNLHLYIDDAHSTTWFGKHGRGAALELLKDTSRVVVSLSLNKAFGAAGGALVFPNDEMRDRVRVMGGPFSFSGPIQPPLLGAALASANLHLTPEFESTQAALRHRITLLQALSLEAGITLATPDVTPIFFTPLGGLEAMISVTKGMQERGFFLCPAGFPAVPVKQSGVRFTVSTLLEDSDIVAFVDALAEEIDLCGISRNQAQERAVPIAAPKDTSSTPAMAA